MTKEQGKAIERLEKRIKDNEDYKTTQVWLTDDVSAVYTVLNMLKEKDKEIESLEKTLDEKYIFVTGARTLYAGLMSLDKENIVKDDLKLRNEIYQHIEDTEKKDKQINYMANFINDNTPYTKDTKELENEEGIRTVDFTVKYFERKSKE